VWDKTVNERGGKKISKPEPLWKEVVKELVRIFKG
jgi:hypothetical protein